jgi:hypothetical protein
LHPFWGSSATPIGKGSGHLSKLRCQSTDDLAITQLKSLKLLVWALLLGAASWLLQHGARAVGIPPLDQVLDGFVHGKAAGVGVGWLAIVIATAVGALDLAAWGHQIVACARLAGFKLRRNTWRPLESRSMADFWNRYYYYFKELLLDFFFYPAFFRFFKKAPRLRLFFATFMAAGVGNALYHFFRDVDLLFSMGPRAALLGFDSYVFYCVVLALSIAISQLRSGPDSAPKKNGVLPRAWSFACVWSVVLCLHVFGGIESRTYSLQQRLSFMAHQLGVHL